MDLFLVLLFGFWLFLFTMWGILIDGLLLRFRRRMPEVAAREIPFVFDDSEKHLEKTLFFYRSKAIAVLKQDPQLWRQRQSAIAMTIVLAVILVIEAICMLGRLFRLF